MCFSDEVLGHNKIISKLSANFIVMVLITINKMFTNKSGKLNKLTQCNKQNMSSAVRKLYREIKDKKTNETGISLTANSVKNTEKFIKRLTQYYDDLETKKLEMSEDDVSDDDDINDTKDDENSDDDSSSSEQEKIVVRKKQQKPTPTVKKQVVIRKITKK